MKLRLSVLQAIIAALLVAALTASAAVSFRELDDTGDLANLVFSPGDRTGGASWGDYDGDGHIDLFLCGRSDGLNVLFRNDGQGGFISMNELGIGDLSDDNVVARQGVWGDIDNDGDLDMYLFIRSAVEGASAPPLENRIYVNNGDGTFTRKIVEGSAQAGMWPNSGSLVDFDNDGYLDVFLPTWHDPTGPHPEVLFRNEGNFNFTRVTLRNAPGTFTVSAAWADYDGDGDLDVVVANQGGSAFLFKNMLRESSVMEMVAVQTGAPEAAGINFTMSGGAAWGDFDNNGELDLITTNDDLGMQIHFRTGSGQYLAYESHQIYSSGVRMVALFDADNDGNLDILADLTTGSGGYRLFLNQGGGRTFSDEFFASTRQFSALQRAPAIGDFNNDGNSDVYIVYPSLSGALFMNEGSENRWLKLVLKGTVSNHSAVGAIVRVKAVIQGQEVWQMRQVSAGGEAWRVQHDMRPNFGLGDASVADVVRIEWPSGIVQELTNVAASQILTVVEPPRLTVEAGGKLSWPVRAEGYRLDSATSVGGSWSEAIETVTTEGTWRIATIEPNGEAKFYRLTLEGMTQ